jgi:GNAT superfamily N-acetyltransferase
VLDLQPAVAGDAHDLHALREAAARWLQERGVDQWRPGEVDRATFGAQIAAGEWFVDRLGGSVRAAVRLLWTDPQFWGARPDDAGYVHGLMIDRRHAGEGLGAASLRWAEEQARAAGKTYLRLDHAAGNGRLARYYSELGFAERGRRVLDARGPVVLAEKPLGDGRDRFQHATKEPASRAKTPEVIDLRGSPGTTGTR